MNQSYSYEYEMFTGNILADLFMLWFLGGAVLLVLGPFWTDKIGEINPVAALILWPLVIAPAILAHFLPDAEEEKEEEDKND